MLGTAAGETASKVKLLRAAEIDCARSDLAPAVVVAFVLAEAESHPRMFSTPFSACPFPMGPKWLVVFSWDGKIACIERVVERSERYQGYREWVDCLTQYRLVADSEYRRSGRLEDGRARARRRNETMVAFRRLMRSARPLLSSGLVNGDMLRELVADADEARLNGEEGQAIAKLEMALSLVHKVLLAHDLGGGTSAGGDADLARGRHVDVLVVDDERSIVAALSRFLGGESYTVDATESPEMALRLLARTAYRSVVLDLMMPGIDGLEVALHARRVLPAAKIVLCTGYPKASLEASVGLGLFDAILTKPVLLRELLPLIAAPALPGGPRRVATRF